MNQSIVHSQNSPKVRVLVVDDAPEFRQLIVHALSKGGFVIETADEGNTALEVAASFRPDLIVLDLGLPSVDGLEVCRRIRAFSSAYILMLTGRDEEVDKVVGLSVGADDYMTKPFSPRELLARVQAMLRRPRSTTDVRKESRVGDLLIDLRSREVSRDGVEIPLTRVEFDLLAVLVENPRAVLRRSELVAQVWGPQWFGDDHIVDVHISNLRRKLGEDTNAPRYIETVRGVGYRLARSAATSTTADAF